MDDEDGWRPDPTGRFEERYVLRGEWSALVRSGDDEQIDAPVGCEPLPKAEPEPEVVATAPVPVDLPPPVPGSEMAASQAPRPPVAPPSTGHRGRLSGRRGRVAVGVAAVLAVAAAGLGGFLVLGPKGAEEARSASWDPAIEPLRTFVERQRGVEFLRPVEIVTLSDADFEAALIEAPGLSSARPAAMASSASVAQALGIVEQPDEFADAAEWLVHVDIASYDPASESIRVRAGVPDPVVRLQLVYELALALDDQHLDVGSRIDARALDDADLAFAGVLIAAAVKLGDSYRTTLTTSERALVDQADEQSLTALDEMSLVLEQLLLASSISGAVLLDVTASLGPDGSTAAVLRNPPLSTAELLDPARPRGSGPTDVPAATPRPDDVVVDERLAGMGALAWYLVLANRIGPNPALAAVEGWSGDSVTVVDPAGDDGRVCALVAMSFRDAESAGVFAFALASATTPADVTVPGPGRLDLRLCSDGTWSPTGGTAGLIVVLGPSVHHRIASAARQAGAAALLADCAADAVIANLDRDHVDDESLLQQLARDALTSCRAATG